MKISTSMEAKLQLLLDFLYACIPRSQPPAECFADAKIVSHRGQHDNRRVIENTLPAFDRVLQAGIWGIEFDIRWTKDHVPICFHDPDLMRLFGDPRKIGSMTRDEIRDAFPLIPTLKTLVERYAGQLHLMIELKAVDNISAADQNRILADTLAGLGPGHDYHLMSLDPEIFVPLHAFSPRAMLPIARLDVNGFSRTTLERGYGGLAGHYFLIRPRLIARHQSASQRLGTGFIGSRNLLFRELTRGITWLFSDDALGLKSICDRYANPGP